MDWIILISLGAWTYLVFLHHGFWQADQRLAGPSAEIRNWPSVGIVIPARNEEDTIGRTIRSLLDQDYAGDFHIVLVNDNSTDATLQAANSVPLTDSEKVKLEVVDGESLRDGWVGKMWAVAQGVEAAGEVTYLLLTDADIEHAPNSLSSLVAKAETERLGLVSLMVRLRCISFWERLLIPAFIYFFQKLYPFPAVNNPGSDIAAAAGGCMLIRRSTLAEIGGMESIKDEIIDDCALARRVKLRAPIWLGLGENAKSIRPYDDLNAIWNMVARSAYVQLSNNPLWLIGTIAGMVVLYLIPPLGLIYAATCGDPLLVGLAAAACFLMIWSYLPTIGLYKQSVFWTLTLPIAGFLYTLMTIDSARRHYMKDGAEWKGRAYKS